MLLVPCTAIFRAGARSQPRLGSIAAPCILPQPPAAPSVPTPWPPCSGQAHQVRSGSGAPAA